VRFTGRLAPDALADLRARAAVVLAPSRWEEPCPYSVLEALATGVPVLASDRGGLPELVGEDAVLPATDSVSWSAALTELWERPQLREARGQRALERARRQFGEAGYYERLTRLYDGVSP
jgi:glycosyltransferase involved in cell wall biosynthesis